MRDHRSRVMRFSDQFWSWLDLLRYGRSGYIPAQRLSTWDDALVAYVDERTTRCST